jgi:hypothetical protein
MNGNERKKLAALSGNGFFDYNDLATTGTPVVVTAVGSPVDLPNDGIGAFTNKRYAPPHVTEVWDVVNGLFDWSQLKLGDTVDIRLDIDVITATVNTEIQVDLHLGAGGGAYMLPFYTPNNFKTTGTKKVLQLGSIYMGDENTLNNGGVLKITTDKDCTVVVNGWYVRIIPWA